MSNETPAAPRSPRRRAHPARRARQASAGVAAVLAVGTVGVLTLTDRADAGPSSAVDASQAPPQRSSFDGGPGRHGHDRDHAGGFDQQAGDDSGWLPSQPDAGSTWNPGGDTGGAFGGDPGGAFGGDTGASMGGSLGGSRSGAS